MKKMLLLFSIMALLFSAVVASGAATGIAKGTPLIKPEVAVKTESCLSCHETVKMLYDRGAHSKVNCGSCHSVPAGHLTAPNEGNRPVVRMDHDACGQCHDKQAASMGSTEYHKIWSLSNPWIQNYMYKDSETGTTNTLQSIAPRGHGVALQDLVMSSTRGRYVYKDGRAGLTQLSGKMWDMIDDVHPEDGDNATASHGRAGTALRPHAALYLVEQAACFSCKTSEMILDWPYGGDPAPGAKYNLRTRPAELMKGLNTSMTCNTCHDPHSAEPRIVRDTIIKALTDPRFASNVYQSDPNRTKLEVITMGLRGYDRKIAILEKYDSALMCGQCHSFTNRGGMMMDGTRLDPLAGDSQIPIMMHPYEAIDFFKKEKMYTSIDPVTGARVWGGFAHVQMESHIGSVHEKAGVGCSDCHYAQKTEKKTTYSSHQTALPLLKTKETCLKSGCHGADTAYKWDEATAQYAIKITQQLQRKRLADLEVGVNRLALAIVEAQKTGADTAAIEKAQEAYSDVSFVATFWLKEYSGGFHNPDLSETTLMRAYVECTAALAELSKAVKK